REEFLNLELDGSNIGVDLLKRTRRSVAVEVPSDADLVSDLCLVWIHPSVGDVGQHLRAHVVADRTQERDRAEAVSRIRQKGEGDRRQRNVLVVPQFGVRFNVAAVVL